MKDALWHLVGEHDVLAIAACDQHGRLVLVTPGLERMLGHPIGSLEGRGISAWTLHDPAVPEAALDLADYPLSRALRGETVVDQVVATHRPDGRMVVLRCSSTPVGPPGDARSAVLLAQDVTADWVATRQHEVLRDRLVRTLNHELRTPLTKILGHAELVEEWATEARLPGQVIASVQAIVKGAQELATMASKLTHLADLDALSQPDLVQVDVGQVVREALDAERGHARERQVRVDFVATAPVRALADPEALGRAVTELVVNSVQHSPPHDEVAVSLRPYDGHFEISVADHGSGIPSGERERLLQPFERGEDSDPSASSTGLGLAVVNAIAAAHAGSVVLDENTPTGLVVRLCLRSDPRPG